jgi:hypothetical protein
MPIDLSKLSAEDITTTTAAMEAARRAHEEGERREAEEWQRWQEVSGDTGGISTSDWPRLP